MVPLFLLLDINFKGSDIANTNSLIKLKKPDHVEFVTATKDIKYRWAALLI